MNKITLTSRGKDILTQNTLQGGEVYWVGYFGLAYVPDQKNFSEDQTRLIGESEHGDYIYNLWQGDLVNEGHSIAADSLSKLTLYDRNITSNFRYVYDEERGRNRLVTWVSGANGGNSGDSETSSYVRTGYRVYNGITMGESNDTDDIVSESELPCPAPLFYAGGSASYGNPPATPGDFMNSVIYSDWPMYDNAAGTCPMVTPDMRFYGGSWKGGSSGSAWDWVPDAAGKYDTLPSYYTRTDAGGGVDSAVSLDQYAKYISISNFNKDHGHVSSEGYGVGFQESCHNMSMVTRLFPIANYELTATNDPATDDPNMSERGSAKSIKYVIRMNLKAAYQGVRAYLDTLNYTSDSADEDELALFTSAKPNSFKFNRIGIYAVRATIRHFYKEGDAGNRTDCRATHYQMEISPDARPELFAVMQVDEVRMSEDGSFGLGDYNTTFVLNLENAPENNDLCTTPEVYYNLVENEAITWYQNQLLATAGLSEAVTNLGVNLAHLMNGLGKQGTNNCYGNDLQYAQIDHTHNYLKNLVDDTCGEGSVRDIMSADNTMPLPALGKAANEWSCGVLSFTMGDNNATLGDYSFNMTINGDIDENSEHVMLMGGMKRETPVRTTDDDGNRYVTLQNSSYSMVMAQRGDFYHIHNSLVLAADDDNRTDGALGVKNSLVFGSGDVTERSIVIDSIVNTSGDSISESSTEGFTYTYPESISSSVWLGYTDLLSVSSQRETESKPDTYMAPVKNVFLFTGDANMAHQESICGNWLGRGTYPCGWYRMLTDDSAPEALRSTTTPEDVVQPYSSPMVFTGGIAIGGHLVLGYEMNSERAALDYHSQPGSYGLMKVGTGYRDDWVGFSNHEFFSNHHSPSVIVGANAWKVHQDDATTGTSQTYYLGNATAGSVDVTQVYSNQLGADHSAHHWLVHSPHAGKPLVATEMQELDGTLHMGLGQDYMHGNSGGITKIECAYLDFKVEFRITYQDEPTYYIDVIQDKDYENDQPREATYKVGYTVPTEDFTPSTEHPVVSHDVSGVWVRFVYHYDNSVPNAPHDLVIDELSVGIPTSRPNIHSFFGNASSQHIRYGDGVHPVFVMSDCDNITDTNCYLCDGSYMFNQEERLVRFNCAYARMTGPTYQNPTPASIEDMTTTPVLAKLDRWGLYRFSAVNYRTKTAKIPSAGNIPLRMEKIPFSLHDESAYEGFGYIGVDAEIHEDTTAAETL